MSVPTMKPHVTRLLGKLDLNNRVQIALLAMSPPAPTTHPRRPQPEWLLPY